MHKKKILIAIIGGGAFGANIAHEAHRELDLLHDVFASTAEARPPTYCCLPHGPEPEGPSAPFHGYGDTTVTATGTAAIADLSGYLYSPRVGSK